MSIACATSDARLLLAYLDRSFLDGFFLFYNEPHAYMGLDASMLQGISCQPEIAWSCTT